MNNIIYSYKKLIINNIYIIDGDIFEDFENSKFVRLI